jgi:hypothetical protein
MNILQHVTPAEPNFLNIAIRNNTAGFQPVSGENASMERNKDAFYNKEKTDPVKGKAPGQNKI